MKQTPTTLLILPIGELERRICLTEFNRSQIDSKDILELLISMWLKDQHLALHGDYLGNSTVDEDLRIRIEKDVIRPLVIDPIYIEEITNFRNLIHTVALLLFELLEQLLPLTMMHSSEVINVRFVRWLSGDVMLEVFN